MWTWSGSRASACTRPPSAIRCAAIARKWRNSRWCRSAWTYPRGRICRWRARWSAFPYVPADPRRRDERCMEVYNIQVQALVQRLSSSKISKVVIGVSGGLDSTHALLVCAAAMDRLGLPRANILGYTMPGFATSDRTLDQARQLMSLDRLHGARDRYPPQLHGDAERSRPSVRAGRAGLRRDLRERAGRRAHQPPVPAGQPSSAPS